jgi:2,4-dienoyl-CoA reductase-like NADH-dependent reductase (Old Yellow Enzyme family)/pyruvate/2-oxoglutarate dehydrogenase complex dihydrolipoamide dehydrogenase (E3) component
MAYEHVLSPLKVGGIEIKNRVLRTAHGTNLGFGELHDDIIGYHEARAKGGVGLSLTEATGVHKSGPLTLNAFDDEIIPRYQALMAAVRPHGMKMFSQLNHLGAVLGNPGDRPWSASEFTLPGNVMTIAMTTEQIEIIIDAFVQGARRAVEGGMDGIEIHAAHGFLIQQFISQSTNQRDDRYGGSFENRMRFYLEILRACRNEVGPGFVMGTRVGPHNFPGGLNVDEHIDIANRIMQEDGLIDYLNVSHGSPLNSHKVIGGMHEKTGYELGMARQVTAVVDIPTFITGRFRTLADADAVIAAGDADMVGMTRAHIADPNIVAKTIAGREDEIRPCIGCNQGCIGGLNTAPGWNGFGRFGCTINVAAGHEYRLGEDLLAPVDHPRHVLVVGAGPAGMEAARVARLRGHTVTLAEATERLGGSVQIARLAPNHEGIGDIVDWLAAEMDRRGVDVRLNQWVDGDFVRALNPDAIIMATGATARMDGTQNAMQAQKIEGVDQDHVIATRQLLQGHHNQIGETALVFDEVGGYEGIGAAEFLVEQGAEVTFVTSLPAFAPRMAPAGILKPALERLNSRGTFRLITDAWIERFGPDNAIVHSLVGRPPEEVAAETAVLIVGGRPNIDLLDELDAEIEVHTIGDASQPNFLPAAFAQANLAARAV